MSWTWQGRQLVKAEKDKKLSFTYDSEGVRTSKTVGSTTTKYLLNGTQILAQTTNGKTLCFFYDQQGNRVGMADGSNKFYYYIYNVQGDVIALADASTGKLAVTYTYDAWGKLIELKDTTANSVGSQNPFRYKGYYYDTETSLYYLQTRYYDPEVGRFINADRFATTDKATPLGTNTFSYCENNPVMRCDSTGEWAHILIGAAVGIGIQFMEDIAVSIATQTPFDENISSLGTYASAVFSGGFAAATGGGIAVGVVDAVLSTYIQTTIDAATYYAGLPSNTSVEESAEGAGVGAIATMVTSPLRKNEEKISCKIGAKYKGSNKLALGGIKAARDLAFDALSRITSIINVGYRIWDKLSKR